jgi:hypothetical protein
MKAEIAALRAAQYVRPQSEPAPSASTIVALPVQPQREAPTSAEHQRVLEEERVREKERQQFYAATFEQEPRDRAWGNQMESRVTSAVSAAAFPGTHVESVDCRSTLCKVVLSHDDAAAEQAVGSFPMAVPEFAEGTLSASNDAKGRLLTVGYFARSGHKLPSDEPTSAKF